MRLCPAPVAVHSHVMFVHTCLAIGQDSSIEASESALHHRLHVSKQLLLCRVVAKDPAGDSQTDAGDVFHAHLQPSTRGYFTL